MLESTSSFGKFEFRPLEPGFGMTVGNALRRILLSSLEGYAITTVKVAGVDHEFAAIPGVMEDMLNIILNLKQVRFIRTVDNQDAEKVSILDDIDFSIEIIQTDKINVAYIMNLLKNMDRKDKKQREKDIKHIYDELDRTDNPELKKKVELIKRFIGDVLVGLPEDASVEEAYVDFEDKERNEEIEAFAKEKDVDADKIKQIISEYEFSHTLTKDMIKEQIPMALPFRERRALIQAIIDFITQNCDKYQ